MMLDFCKGKRREYLDAELNLIVCEHATSSLIRERPDGRREVLASHFENQELNSPNDVVAIGSLYILHHFFAASKHPLP